MKTIIAYFSYSNTTKHLVEAINKEFNFDVVRIEKVTPYSSNYNQCAYVEAKEEVENTIYPKIKEINIDFSIYDQVLLFFPIWWYTIPMVIGTFVKENLKDYKGKVVVFPNSYSNVSEYFPNSLRDLCVANGELNYTKGLFNKSVKDHIKYITNIS